MSEKLNLYAKILNVMKDIQYLNKDSRVTFGTTDYRVLSEEKVTCAVRESLIKNGLVILPISVKITKEGSLTTVNTGYKIIDTDTGEFETLESAGQGTDTQDKGSGKSLTYAYKYLLLRTFAIPSGEDPDKTSSEELDKKEVKAENLKKSKQEEKPVTKEERLTPKQIQSIRGIKESFHITLNSDLNKYVKYWSEKTNKNVNSHEELNTTNVDDFCKFIKEHGNEVVPF